MLRRRFPWLPDDLKRPHISMDARVKPAHDERKYDTNS
jgi:hypothetical protein